LLFVVYSNTRSFSKVFYWAASPAVRLTVLVRSLLSTVMVVGVWMGVPQVCTHFTH